MKKKNAFKTLAACSVLTCCTMLVTSCNNVENPTTSSPEPSTTDSVVTADKIALERKLEYVENNYLDKEASYTKETFDALKAAYEEAKAIYEKADATQEEIDAVLAKLNKAIEGLVSVIKPSKTVDEIAEWMEGLKGNYTLEVTDHFSKPEYATEPHKFNVLADGESVYDAELKRGVTAYDGYIHEFSVDGNDKVVMGRKHLGDSLFPARFLEGKEMGARVVNLLGVSQPFTSLGLPIYGFFEPVTNSTVLKSDNSNYYDFYLGLTFDRYNYGNKVEDMFSAATMEFENEIFTASLLDNEGQKAFEFTVKDEGKTQIADLKEYKATNETYASNAKYAPKATADKIVENKATSGLKVDVFSNQRGNEGQVPNFTITSRVNEGGSSYWNSSLGYGVLDSKTMTLKDDIVKFTGNSKFDAKELDIVTKVIANYDSYKDTTNDDEYYKEITDAQLQKDIYNYFDLANYQSWASKDFFDEAPNAVEPSDIKKVSLSLNDKEELMISVWGERGIICRGVVKAYENVKLPVLEDAAGISKSALKEALEAANKITNAEAKYEAKSFANFEAIRTLATTIVENEAATVAEIEEATAILKARQNELELATFTPSAKGYKDVTSYIEGKIYVDEYGIGEYEFSSYTLDVVQNSQKKTTVVNSNYSYNITEGKGVVRYEGIVYNFTVVDGEFKLGSPVIHPAGFSQTYVDRVAKKIGKVADMGTDELEDFKPATEMVRVPNSNEWIIANTSYADFLGVDTSNASCVGLEVKGDKLVVNLYEGSSLQGLKVEGASALETLVLNRKNIIASGTISAPGASKNAELDAFIKNTTPLVTKDTVALFGSLLGETSKVTIAGSDEVVLMNKDFAYFADTNTAYIQGQNKVLEVSFEFDPVLERPFKIVDAEVKLDDGTSAKTVEDLVGSIEVLKTIEASNLVDYEFKGKTSTILSGVDAATSAKLTPFVTYFGSGDNDICLTVDGMSIAIVEVSFRYESYITVTGRLEEAEDMNAQMCANLAMVAKQGLLA